MGKSLDQIVADVHDGDSVGVTLATNQDNGIVGYATGLLLFRAGTGPPVFKPGSGGGRLPALATVAGAPLEFYFSDRKPPGNPHQPFAAGAIDRLGLSMSIGVGPPVVALTFSSWGGATAHLSMAPRGNVLVGTGPSLGESAEAVYLLSFTGILRHPR